MGKFIVILYSLTFVACNSYQQNPIVGDYSPASNCPSGGCASTAVVTSGLTMSTAQEKIIMYKSTDNYVEVSGNCGFTNYANNAIEVYIYSSVQSRFEQLTSNDYRFNIRTANAVNESIKPQCIRGRYDIFINKSAFGGNPNPSFQLLIRGCNVDAGQDCSSLANSSLWDKNESNGKIKYDFNILSE